MNGQERASAVKWGVIGLIAVLAALAGIIAWVQINFGPTAAVVSVGGLFGVGIFWLGIKTAQSIVSATHQNTNYTLESASNFVGEIEQTRTAYARAENERARMERERFKLEARAAFDDTRRIEQFGKQYAGMLIDAQAQQQAQQPAQVVAMNDANTGGGPLYWDEE